MAVSLVASPTIINVGGLFGVTWNGAPAEVGDWIGLYTAGSPDSSPWVWVMGEAPSYTWTLPATVPPNANYEFRLFSKYSFNRIGTSNHVWVQDPNYATSPVPVPVPQPDPQPTSGVLYDLTGAMWYPGPIINGVDYSPGTPDYYVGTIGPWPHPPGEIDYVTTPAPGALPLYGRIVFRFRLKNGPLLGTVEPYSSAMIFLHIQRRGDTWSGQGQYDWYRAWSLDCTFLINVPEGAFTLNVPLTADQWGGVMSGAPHQDFANLLANADVLGFTFGDAQSKGHGNQNSTGATIEILEFKVYSP